MLADSIWAC